MIRVLEIHNISDARRELTKINVSTQGVEVMCWKAFSLIIKLSNIEIGAANILKQEMLILGGDAAISRGTVEGTIKKTDAILLGTIEKITKLSQRLKYYNTFDFPKIDQAIKQLLKTKKNPINKLVLSNGTMDLNYTKIMGILNITKDSFSDGNKFFDPDTALQHALKMANSGASIIDIGGESTRPGAEPVSEQQELDRVIPIIERISQNSDICISVDTYKSKVAEEAIKHGAQIVNDISALQEDDNMVNVIVNNPDIPIILMHKKGKPKTMQNNPYYEDVITEIYNYLHERISFCQKHGININRIIIDPGIGFGKRFKDNMDLLKHIGEFHSLGVPILLGASRKSFINDIYKSSPENRLEGSLATSALAFNNKIQFIRVHDVESHFKFLQTLQAIYS